MTTSQTDLLERARKHLIRYCRTWQPPVIASGRGSTVVDVDGREYLDFTSGQMCATIGHNHPRMVEALEMSGRRILHLNSTLLAPETIELAERLASILPPPLSMSIILNTGSESNEIALKMAKLATGRFETVGLTRSFHGLTGGAGSSTYAIARRGHGPALPGFALPAPYCYRCPVRSEFPGCDFLCLRAGFDLVDAESVGSLAACIVEPIISAGGLIDPPRGYLAALREECRKRGMIYILDEAQTAFGRLDDVRFRTGRRSARYPDPVEDVRRGRSHRRDRDESRDRGPGGPKRIFSYHLARVRSHAFPGGVGGLGPD